MRSGAVVVSLIAAAGQPVEAQPPRAQVSWDGDCGTTWESFCGGGTVTNWDHDMLPTSNDDVAINGASVGINSTLAPQVVRSMSLTSGTLTGWVAALDGATISNSDFTGTFETVGLTSFIGFCTVSGTLRGPGSYSTSGSWTFNDSFIGEIGVPTSISNTGIMRLNFEPNIRDGSCITSTGTIEFGSRGITGLGTLESSGTVRKVELGGAFVATNTTISGGTIDVQAGELRFTNANTFSGGTATVAQGATLTFGGTNVEHCFSGLSQISGQGTARFSSGPALGAVVSSPLSLNMTGPGVADLGLQFTLNASLTNQGDATIAGARVLGGGGLTNEAGATVTVQFSSNTNLATDSDITNRGTFFQLSPIDRATAASVSIINEPGGVWEALYTPTQHARFDNRGTLYRRNVAGRVVFDTAFAGEFDMTDGTVILEDDANTSFEGGGTWQGVSLVRASSDAGAIIASEVLVSSGTTTLQTTGTGVIVVQQEVGGTNLTVDGSLVLDGQPSSDPLAIRILHGDEIVGSGSIVNQGNFMMLFGASLGDASNLGSFTNNKNLVFGNISNDGQRCSMDLTNNADVYQLADLDIGGSPTINHGTWRIAPASDNGDIDPDLQTSITSLGGEIPFTNLGTFIADGSIGGSQDEATVSANFDNQGTVYVTSDMKLGFFGGVAQNIGGALVGGTWIVEPGGLLQLPGPVSVVAGNTRLVGGSSSIPILDQIDTLEGRIDTNDPITLDGPLDIDSGGILNIGRNGPVFSPGPVTNEAPVNSVLNEVRVTQTDPDVDQRLGDPCPIIPDLEATSFDNHSLLDPGPAGEVIGMRIAAPTTFHPTAILKIDLAGVAPCTGHDRVEIEGALILAGTLEVAFAPDYAPSPHDTFTVISATGGIAGTFDVISAPPGQRVRAVYSPTDVTLVASCFSDCDSNGSLNIDDIDCFVAAFLDGELPDADCDGNGVLNLDDIDCFVTGFLGGCP